MIKASKAKYSSLKFKRLAGEMYHHLLYLCIPDIMNIYKIKTAVNIACMVVKAFFLVNKYH